MGAKRSPLRAIAILSSCGSLTKPPYITDFPFSSNTGGCLSPEYSFYHVLSELHHLKFMLDDMTWLLLHQSSTPNTAHERVPRCSYVRWLYFSLRSYTLLSRGWNKVQLNAQREKRIMFVFGQLECHRDTSEQGKDPFAGDFCYQLTEEKAAEQVALLEDRMIQVEYDSNLFHIPSGYD